MSQTLVATPAVVDLRLQQGDDFTFTLTVTNPDGSAANLTGATIAAQIRQTAASSSPLGTFTTSVASNVITLTLPNSLSFTISGTAVWDCQMTASGGAKTTLAGGQLVMNPEVTRP